MTRTVSLPTDVLIDPLVLSWSDGTLLAATAAVDSGFIDLADRDSVRVVRTATAGTYALEIDWSRDGVAVDVVETVTPVNNTSAKINVATRFARFRVRNTHATDAFTAHRTTISAR